jgi:hypothetical protein
MINKKSLGTVIATAAALAFATAPFTSTVASAAGDDVHCYGVNSCKGTSACKTAKNECKGMNACKGSGFVMKSSDECKKLGGTTEESTS